VYGQSGLEASLDDYLRGVKGNPSSTIVWNHLLYGMSPHGLDVRLSIDLYLQYRADELMIGHNGAIVILNARSGEILVMASHPTFNPNHLNEIGSQLNKDPQKPLINRAVQGLYPVGNLLEPFTYSIYQTNPTSPDDLRAVAESFGLDHAPQLQMQVASSIPFSKQRDLHISPMQAALAAAALSNHGTIPAPRIAIAVDTPEQGWVILPALGTSIEAIPASDADAAAQFYIKGTQNYWSNLARAIGDESKVTWFIAGTPPNWQAEPLVIVVTVEEDNTRLAEYIGRELLIDAMNP
jgi:cell division protein FtsI/penicillin-binding protein 2